MKTAGCSHGPWLVGIISQRYTIWHLPSLHSDCKLIYDKTQGSKNSTDSYLMMNVLWNYGTQFVSYWDTETVSVTYWMDQATRPPSVPKPA